MAILCLRRYKKELFSKKNKFYLYDSKISNVICCLSFYFLSNRFKINRYFHHETNPTLIEGMQYLNNLVGLELNDNQVTDLTPLKKFNENNRTWIIWKSVKKCERDC